MVILTGPVLFWLILAGLYIALAFQNYVFYKEIEEKVGNIYVGKEIIVVGELNDTEAANLVELSGIFKSIAITNLFGFILAALAAIISARNI